jgi:hypothetical protein
LGGWVTGKVGNREGEKKFGRLKVRTSKGADDKRFGRVCKIREFFNCGEFAIIRIYRDREVARGTGNLGP